jgi:hypothetical protein
MTVYNIRVTLVELVEASSPEDAYNQVAAVLDRAGFDAYDGDRDDDIASAFESEDQSPPSPLPSNEPRYID